jgi:hypothetical protein
MKLIAQYDPDWGDEEDYEDAWFWFEEEVNYAFEKVFPKGEVGMIAKNHGWMKRDGYLPVENYANGMNAIRKAMVNGASVKVYVGTNGEYGRHIAINTAHHDSPCWDEWTYIVRPKYMKEVA